MILSFKPPLSFLVLLAWIQIFGLGALNAADLAAQPTWFPSESCKSKWSKLIPKNEHGFRFGIDRDYKEYKERIDRKNCYKDWNILVYMAADNNLAPYALWDLFEMEAGYESGRRYAGSGVRTDLIAQVELPEKEIQRIHLFQTPEAPNKSWSKREYLALKGPDIQSPRVRVSSETGSNHQGKLEEFLAWGMREYPALNTMVIVWGHGQGWSSGVRASNSQFNAESGAASGPFVGRKFTGGIAFDDSDGSYLSIPELRKSLQNVRMGVNEGKPIDIYLSDACLMQMGEVANEISDEARFIIGSAQVQDYLGIPYRRLMYYLNSGTYKKNPESSIESDDLAYMLAIRVPAIARASYSGGNSTQGRYSTDAVDKITMSTLSPSALKYQLIPAINKLGESLLKFIEEDELRLGLLTSVIESAPEFQGGGVDFGSFLVLLNVAISAEAEFVDSTDGLRSLSKLQTVILTVQQELRMTVLSSAAGNAYLFEDGRSKYLGFSSFSIFLPNSHTKNRVPDFMKSKFYLQAPKWAEFIDLL